MVWEGRTLFSKMVSAGGRVGVDGVLELCRFRFQKPAFGPFMIKERVQRDRPRSVSGRWMAAPMRVENESMKVSL